MGDKLVFRKLSHRLLFCSHSDADWAGTIDSPESTSGTCVKLNDMPGCVRWLGGIQRKKPTFEAETNACDNWCHEVVYLQFLLNVLSPKLVKALVFM